MAEVDIRPMAVGDLAAMRNLFEACFGDRREEDYDRWRLFETPQGMAPTTVAAAGGELVAAYTLWPTRLTIGGEEVQGAQSMDSMTHPGWQRRGLFSKLAKQTFERVAAEGYEVLYGFPNANSFPGFVHKLHWDHVGDVPLWTRPILSSVARRLPVAAAHGVLSRTRRRFGRSRLTIDAERPDAAAIDALLAAHTDVDGIARITRDAAWFEWRYRPSTERTYRWFAVRDGADLCGLLVLGADDDPPGGEAHVCEAVGATPAALSALVGHAVRQCYVDRRRVLKTMTNEPAVVSALRRHGFIRRPALPLIVKPLTLRPLGANVHHFDSWRIMAGDHDIY